MREPEAWNFNSTLVGVVELEADRGVVFLCSRINKSNIGLPRLSMAAQRSRVFLARPWRMWGVGSLDGSL